jgi:hypothetical protein
MTKLILKTRIYEWNLEYRKHSDDIFYDTYERMNALKTDKKKALLKRKHEKREKEKGDGEEREKEKPERQEPEREQPGEQDRPANTSRELTNSMNGDGGSSVMGYNILRTSTRWLRGSQATFNSEPV